MSAASSLTARTATTLEEIRQARRRLVVIAANLPSEGRTHGEMVLLERTLEDLHLLVVRKYGQWQRGAISQGELSDLLDQWEFQEP